MAIEGLASSLDFPLKKLLVVEGSKRSAHSNAYFYGFWKNKCIVLFDTLLQPGVMTPVVPSAVGDGEGCAAEAVGASVEDEEEEEKKQKKDDEKPKKEEIDCEQVKKKKGCNTAQILGVLAHELGHWKLSHNLKNLAIGEVGATTICLGDVASMLLSHCSHRSVSVASHSWVTQIRECCLNVAQSLTAHTIQRVLLIHKSQKLMFGQCHVLTLPV